MPRVSRDVRESIWLKYENYVVVRPASEHPPSISNICEIAIIIYESARCAVPAPRHIAINFPKRLIAASERDAYHKRC